MRRKRAAALHRRAAACAAPVTAGRAGHPLYKRWTPTHLRALYTLYEKCLLTKVFSWMPKVFLSLYKILRIVLGVQLGGA